MCKHFKNAAVQIRTACCKRWLDCPKCHEGSDHPLKKTVEMVLACKNCKKVFRLNLAEMEEADQYCPGCDAHFFLSAESALEADGGGAGDENDVAAVNVEVDADVIDPRTKRVLSDEEIEQLMKEEGVL